MIAISTTVYDPNGTICLPRARIRNAYEGFRRGSVTATLDGSVSIYDGGFSYGDQTMTSNIVNPTQAQLIQLRYLVAYYSQILLCCESGCYSSLLSFSLRDETLTLSFRLIDRMDV